MTGCLAGIIGDGKVCVWGRPTGTVTRRLQRGDSLNTERLEAEYDAGVLTLRIPVAERARPSKIEIVSRPELADT